jgi:hypothetical protein
MPNVQAALDRASEVHEAEGQLLASSAYALKAES